MKSSFNIRYKIALGLATKLNCSRLRNLLDYFLMRACFTLENNNKGLDVMRAIDKEEKLKDLLLAYGTVAVAYSGGVDSSYLMSVAHDVLANAALAVIADSPSIPRSELREAVALAEERGWSLQVISTEEFKNKDYQANEGDRCYFCKSELFDRMTGFAKTAEIKHLAYGAIIDDLGDHRPGAKAAEEFSILAPLQDAGLSKFEIRELSSLRKLPTASKASFACLASRFPVGEKVTVEKLSQVEMAEEILRGLNFQQYRARHHGDLCRLEVDELDFGKVLEHRLFIVAEVKKLGYKFVTLDLMAYRTGSTSV